MVTGEVKTAWGCFAEGFDFAGDTAMFLAIRADAQNPVFSGRVSAIIIPVRADSNSTHPNRLPADAAF
jgi:hypothetical protein